MQAPDLDPAPDVLTRAGVWRRVWRALWARLGALVRWECGPDG